LKLNEIWCSLVEGLIFFTQEAFLKCLILANNIQIFFYLLLFDGNDPGIPVQASPMWTLWSSMNTISILTGEVRLQLNKCVDQIQLWAPFWCLAEWENPTNQLVLEILSPVVRMQTVL